MNREKARQSCGSISRTINAGVSTPGSQVSVLIPRPRDKPRRAASSGALAGVPFGPGTTTLETQTSSFAVPEMTPSVVLVPLDVEVPETFGRLRKLLRHAGRGERGVPFEIEKLA